MCNNGIKEVLRANYMTQSSQRELQFAIKSQILTPKKKSEKKEIVHIHMQFPTHSPPTRQIAISNSQHSRVTVSYEYDFAGIGNNPPATRDVSSHLTCLRKMDDPSSPSILICSVSNIPAGTCAVTAPHQKLHVVTIYRSQSWQRVIFRLSFFRD